jgi:hypothetical protein
MSIMTKTNKDKRSEDNHFEYKEEGEVKILKLQCEGCSHQPKELHVCKKYTDRKPIGVLRCEEVCPKFEAKQ